MSDPQPALRACSRRRQWRRSANQIWLEVGDEEQKRRFEGRIDDPLRQWNLSAMDLPSPQQMVGQFSGLGSDVAGYGYRTCAVAYRAFRRQAPRAQNPSYFSLPFLLAGTMHLIGIRAGIIFGKQTRF